ncbi:hypothetical protein TKK_0001013 [Trichogramma kaykai]
MPYKQVIIIIVFCLFLLLLKTSISDDSDKIFNNQFYKDMAVKYENVKFDKEAQKLIDMEINQFLIEKLEKKKYFQTRRWHNIENQIGK